MDDRVRGIMAGTDPRRLEDQLAAPAVARLEAITYIR